MTCFDCLIFFSELKENVRKVESFLREAETVLREPLKFNQKWTKRAIDDKMVEIQVIFRHLLFYLLHVKLVNFSILSYFFHELFLVWFGTIFDLIFINFQKSSTMRQHIFSNNFKCLLAGKMPIQTKTRPSVP